MHTVTYSRNFTLPVTYWCRNRCGYCSFRSDEPALLKLSEIRAIAREERKKGAVEALVMTGEQPDVHPKMRGELRSWGFPTYVDYIREVCLLLLDEDLLPHTNIGTLSLDELSRLKDVNASMGVMLEALSPAVERGAAHHQAPTKAPALRVETVRAAGELQIPFTSGILFGIGESWEERRQTLEILAALQEKYGHLQEVIVQPLNPQAGTEMAGWPAPEKAEVLQVIREARAILPPQVHLQIPPNLIPEVLETIEAGADDLGGLSDEPDLINRDRPWPDIEDLRALLAANGLELRLRLPIYDEYIEKGWYSPEVGEAMASHRTALRSFPGMARENEKEGIAMAIEIADVVMPGQGEAFKIGDRKKVSSLNELPDSYRQLLEKSVTAILATISAKGLPQLTPVWLNHDGTYVNLNSVRGRQKDKNLRARRDVSIIIVNPENPLHWMSIYGKVEDIIDEDDKKRGNLATQNIDDLTEVYLGQRPYPFRDPKGEIRVLYQVRPTRIVTFGG